MTFMQFRTQLKTELLNGDIWDGVIGEGRMIPGLYGSVPLTYADYVASGRAMSQVETWVAQEVLPFYANSHTESSFCGSYITNLRQAARAEIAKIVGATDEDAVIFAGSGATAGINRLIHLFGVETAIDPVVLIGPYEHHSNILPWRETKARIVEIPEGPDGGPDMDALEEALDQSQGSDLIIGSFSAASNVTGILTDVEAVTALLKSYGALSVWDFAGGGPYRPIDMGAKGGARKDAIVLSPHKFPGGPGASGLLFVNSQAVRTTTPSWPGGGTVRFVSPSSHEYVTDLTAREEAGTPNIVADIRAALALIVKDTIGQAEIECREAKYAKIARDTWRHLPNVEVLGKDGPEKLPIFSFIVKDEQGGIVNPLLLTMMLSDIYGIQVRGGCSCAGPYGHRLLNIGEALSEQMRIRILDGDSSAKPGWVRLNFSYMMSERTARYVAVSVAELAQTWQTHARHYEIDARTGQPSRKLQAA